MVLMAELALMGRFLLLPEILLYRRVGQETSSNRLSPAEEIVWLDPLRTSGIKSPLLLLHLGFIGVALRAPISFSEKVKTLSCALRDMAWDSGENIFRITASAEMSWLPCFVFQRSRQSKEHSQSSLLMAVTSMSWPHTLGLHVGEWVVVRSRQEILSTLDERGRLQELPFQPEMLAFCGQRLRVAKVAHKTCDNIKKTGGRKMVSAVHLEGARCDGAAHGGCMADCVFFWKEAWLKRPEDPEGQPSANPLIDAQAS